MVKKRIRQWYAVYKRHDSEPAYLVSAVSEACVVKWLFLSTLDYKIVSAKVWVFAKVFSGEPAMLEATDKLAPNDWLMYNDGVVYQVVILN